MYPALSENLPKQLLHSIRIQILILYEITRLEFATIGQCLKVQCKVDTLLFLGLDCFMGAIAGEAAEIVGFDFMVGRNDGFFVGFCIGEFTSSVAFGCATAAAATHPVRLHPSLFRLLGVYAKKLRALLLCFESSCSRRC